MHAITRAATVCWECTYIVLCSPKILTIKMLSWSIFRYMAATCLRAKIITIGAENNNFFIPLSLPRTSHSFEASPSTHSHYLLSQRCQSLVLPPCHVTSDSSHHPPTFHQPLRLCNEATEPHHLHLHYLEVEHPLHPLHHPLYPCPYNRWAWAIWSVSTN